LEFDFDEIAVKLKEAGMDEQTVNKSIENLKGAVSAVPEDELKSRIDDLGGTDGIVSAIIKEYKEQSESVAKKETETALGQTEEAEAGKQTDEGDEKELLNIISIDEDMFSDETEEEAKSDEEKSEQVISEIENGVEPAPSVVVNDFFDDDEDIKVNQSEKKKKVVKKQPDGLVKSNRTAKPQPKKQVSVKNMSSRAKAIYIIGLIVLIPLLIALVIAITVILLSLYAAIIALVVIFSVALVLIAAAGTALSLMAIIYGVIQITQGNAIPGIYEIGLGIVAGGVTLGISILLYNFIVRLAPFLFKKMFVLYKFLFKQLTKLLSFVKGVCGKL
jgi:hypothetical protein